MTDRPKHDDTKLLLTIAAVIVTGAAGIALIAGIGSDDTPTPERKVVRATPPAPAPESLTTPDAEYALAVHREADSAEPVEILEPAVTMTQADIEIESETESAPVAFTFEPGENLVAGGLTAWEARDFPRAAAYFEAQVAARDTDAWSWYMLALSRWKSGEPDAAATAMRESAARDASSVKARVNLARIENDRGDFDAALVAADEALALFPAHPEALFLRGRSLYNAGQVDAAVSAIEASIVGDADNAYAHNLLGLIQIEREAFDAAADALETAAALEPDVAFIQNNLGMAMERVAERDIAIAAYRRAVELDAGYAKALANLTRLDPGAVPGTPTEAVATETVPEPEATAGTEVAELAPSEIETSEIDPVEVEIESPGTSDDTGGLD